MCAFIGIYADVLSPHSQVAAASSSTAGTLKNCYIYCTHSSLLYVLIFFSLLGKSEEAVTKKSDSSIIDKSARVCLTRAYPIIHIPDLSSSSSLSLQLVKVMLSIQMHVSISSSSIQQCLFSNKCAGNSRCRPITDVYDQRIRNTAHGSSGPTQNGELLISCLEGNIIHPTPNYWPLFFQAELYESCVEVERLVVEIRRRRKDYKKLATSFNDLHMLCEKIVQHVIIQLLLSGFFLSVNLAYLIRYFNNRINTIHGCSVITIVWACMARSLAKIWMAKSLYTVSRLLSAYPILRSASRYVVPIVY